MALLKRFRIVVWWTTPVEIASALARLVRIQQLSQEDWVKARSLAASLSESWSTIQPAETVRITAIQLVERYDLRAADALQLAAALAWCERAPQGRHFFSTDAKLREAALLAGFDANEI